MLNVALPTWICESDILRVDLEGSVDHFTVLGFTRRSLSRRRDNQPSLAFVKRQTDEASTLDVEPWVRRMCLPRRVVKASQPR